MSGMKTVGEATRGPIQESLSVSALWEKVTAWTLVHHVLLVFSVLFVYSEVFAPGGYGFLEPVTWLSFVEYAVILLFSVLAYRKTAGRTAGILRSMALSMALLVYYVFIDKSIVYLNRVPRLSDIRTFSDGLQVMPVQTVAAALLLILATVTIVILNWQAARQAGDGGAGREPRDAGWGKRFFLMLNVVLGTLLLSMGLQYVSQYNIPSCGLCALRFSDLEGVRRNGRLVTFFWRSVQEIKASVMLAGHVPVAHLDHRLFPGTLEKRRNVYIILLESFIDPRRLEARYDRSPLAPEMERLLRTQGQGDFTSYRTIIYGGNSAQTAFELLSGVPAYSTVASVAYEVLTGRRTFSLPWRLRKEGYQTLAVVASRSKFFNEPFALRSLGFDAPVFLGDLPERYPKAEGDRWLFDGDLFRYGLQILQKRRKAHPGPYLVFFQGLYGHAPFHRNRALRPDRIHAEGQSPYLDDVANVFFYRTQALARFIREIQRMDPEALIVVASDHLPPLDPYGLVLKDGDRYRNIALVIDRGRILSLDGRRAYEVPWIVWDRLTGRRHERRFSRADLERFHMSVLKAGRTGVPGEEPAEALAQLRR